MMLSYSPIKLLVLCLLLFPVFQSSAQTSVFTTIAGGDLYKIDIYNCSRTKVGSTGVGFGDIAFTSNGKLWGIAGGVLYNIDTSTAIATSIGFTGVSGVSLVEVNDTLLFTEYAKKLYAINTNNATATYIDTIGYSATGDFTWYDDDLYMVTSSAGIVKMELNSNYTAINNITAIGTNMPSCEAAITAVFPGDFNAIVGFNGANVIKICQLTGTSSMLCPNLNIGGTPGAAFLRLPTQNPKPTTCLSSEINNGFTDSMICAGDTFYVPFSLKNPSNFAGTNVFTVQLSNVTGSFLTGITNIGTSNGNSTAPIKCVVPTTVVSGNKYRLRIVSSNIVDSSGTGLYDIAIGTVRPQKPVATNNGPICPGDQLNLNSATSTAGVTYRWSGPNGFKSNLQNPVIVPVATADSGAYVVTVGMFGCLARDTTVAIVSLNASALISATGNTPVCENDTIKLVAVITGVPVSYLWNGPAGFSGSGKEVAIPGAKTSMSGAYTLAVTYAGCSGTDTVNILVKPVPEQVGLNLETKLCAGDDLAMSGFTQTPGTIPTWTGPDGFNSGLFNTVLKNVQTKNGGYYVFSATLDGCTSRDSMLVAVNESPEKPEAISNSPVCEGDILTLNVTDTITGADYVWSSAAGVEANASKLIKKSPDKNSTGMYIVVASIADCQTADTIDIEVKQRPVQPIIKSNLPVREGDTLHLQVENEHAGMKYLWTGPNGFTSSSNDAYLYLPGVVYSGLYMLRADSSNGCSSTNMLQVNVDGIPDSLYIILFPTLNNGTFFIKGAVSFEQYMSYHVYDILGKKIKSGQLRSQDKKFYEKIELDAFLASGEYLFVIQVSGALKTLRFTVNRL